MNEIEVLSLLYCVQTYLGWFLHHFLDLYLFLLRMLFNKLLIVPASHNNWAKPILDLENCYCHFNQRTLAWRILNLCMHCCGNNILNLIAAWYVAFRSETSNAWHLQYWYFCPAGWSVWNNSRDSYGGRETS